MNYEELYNVYLFKFDVASRDFYFFTRDELPANGFSSLYAVQTSEAEAISSAGTPAQFKGSVWSTHLIMDFDSEEAAMAAERRLRELGLAYEIYTTGNRGRHFYIQRPHAPSHLLPQIDKLWVKSNFPEADISIYSNLHMFRLPGTRHVKTGLPKKLLYQVPGTPLILPDTIEESKAVLSPMVSKESIFLDDKIMTLSVPWETGHRHEKLIALGLAMKERGEPIEFISRWIQHTNLLFEEQKPQDELERIMDFILTAQV